MPTYPKNVYLVTNPQYSQILGVYGCFDSAMNFIDSTFGIDNFEVSGGEVTDPLTFVPKDPTSSFYQINILCTPLDDVATSLFV